MMSSAVSSGGGGGREEGEGEVRGGCGRTCVFLLANAFIYATQKFWLRNIRKISVLRGIINPQKPAVGKSGKLNTRGFSWLEVF
jgi:hypothetical protein